MTEMVLVPREPSEAMRRAFASAVPESAVLEEDGSVSANGRDWFDARYAAMIAAAPSSPVGEGVRERVIEAVVAHQNRPPDPHGFDACACMGPRNGAPLCPCKMNRAEVLADAILALLSTGEANQGDAG